MDQFMLVYKGGDENWMAKATQEEIATSRDEWQNWMDKLQKTGQLVSLGAPLAFAGFSVNRQGVVNNISNTAVADLVTGYSLIKAENIEEAVDLAKESPILRYPDTSVEVRQVVKME